MSVVIGMCCESVYIYTCICMYVCMHACTWIYTRNAAGMCCERVWRIVAAWNYARMHRHIDRQADRQTDRLPDLGGELREDTCNTCNVACMYVYTHICTCTHHAALNAQRPRPWMLSWRPPPEMSAGERGPVGPVRVGERERERVCAHVHMCMSSDLCVI